MALKIYNSLTKNKEIFQPLKKNRVGMYVCGPTVYSSGHLGHARNYLTFDIIRRWLEHEGYKIKYIMNITDIHDDIKKDTNIKKYIQEFKKELGLLQIKKANKYPRVSRHLKEIKKLINILKAKDCAYQVDGNTYFNVSKCKDYGKLSGRRLDKNLENTRVESDKYERRQAADFALWKGDRPGWHIECSALASKYLGPQFDIHAGGLDLKFPHHENEIAQSEAAFQKIPWVKYWLHSGLLEVNNVKMSKSLNNFITIPELLKKYDARTFRFLILEHHYRSPLNFTEEKMKQAKSALSKLDKFPCGAVDISPAMN